MTLLEVLKKSIIRTIMAPEKLFPDMHNDLPSFEADVLKALENEKPSRK